MDEKKCFGSYCPVKEVCLQCSLKVECAYAHAIGETKAWIHALKERSTKIKTWNNERICIEKLETCIDLIEQTRQERIEDQKKEA